MSERNIIILFLGGMAIIFASISWAEYQERLTQREAMKAGLIQKRDGWASSPLWVKPEPKEATP